VAIDPVRPNQHIPGGQRAILEAHRDLVGGLVYPYSPLPVLDRDARCQPLAEANTAGAQHRAVRPAGDTNASTVNVHGELRRQLKGLHVTNARIQRGEMVGYAGLEVI
jgi:hypothetical protein